MILVRFELVLVGGLDYAGVTVVWDVYVAVFFFVGGGSCVVVSFVSGFRVGVVGFGADLSPLQRCIPALSSP